jgi:hypothetical protein
VWLGACKYGLKGLKGLGGLKVWLRNLPSNPKEKSCPSFNPLIPVQTKKVSRV